MVKINHCLTPPQTKTIPQLYFRWYFDRKDRFFE